jgi:hypothetical protein
MLCSDHTKANKELQRKIAKLREENKDPTLPQKPTPLHTTAVTANYNPQPSDPSLPPHRRMTDSQNTVDESFMVLGQRVSVHNYTQKKKVTPSSQILETHSTNSGISCKECLIICLNQ